MNISDNYRIVFDENNVILQFFEQRVREKKGGDKEEYEYQSNTFYRTVGQALSAFLAKTLHGVKDIQELSDKITFVEEKISEFSKTYVQ